MTPTRVLLGVLVARQLLDLVAIVGQGPSQVASVALIAVLAGLGARWGRRPPTDLAAPAVLFLLAVGVGALHPTSLTEAARLGLLYASPVLVGWVAWSLAPRPEAVAGAVCLGAVVPVTTSAVALALGQQHALISHGYPRLTGLYANHHTLALTATLTALLATWLATRRSGALRVGLLGLAAVALITAGATWVRTAAVFVAAVVLLWGLFERRWGALAAVALAGLGAVAISSSIRDRLGDILAVLTLTAPEQGWAAVGSWRGAIWRDSLAAFVDRGPLAWVGGVGLGGHLTLWAKPLDPHSEPLALWYQLGVAGPLTWVAVHATTARRLWTGDRRFALALLLGAFASCWISNTFVARVTPAWVLWAFVGAALAQGASDAQSARSSER